MDDLHVDVRHGRPTPGDRAPEWTSAEESSGKDTRNDLSTEEAPDRSRNQWYNLRLNPQLSQVKDKA
ncbi:hypothetical protein NDU88_006858 [Pleurodeles waltl]|uniref:Uncharacterized protein n=1 Tax=Pleurodeles waltl TaxID=8319 RepID=A0AAV7UQB2_PLEWA|nr:hypothetical protein NDU88_006858 [Pleurodeles waltl]